MTPIVESCEIRSEVFTKLNTLGPITIPTMISMTAVGKLLTLNLAMISGINNAANKIMTKET